MPEPIVMPDSPFAYSLQAKKLYAIAFLPYYEDQDDAFVNFDPHSVLDQIGAHEYNTWDTWRMIPKNVPIIAPPQVVSAFTDLKVHDGSLDETAVLHPFTNILYRQLCSGNFEFYLDFSYQEEFENFYEFYTHLLEALHGQKKILVLSETPEYAFFGRVFIESVSDSADGNQTSITLAYNIEPYVYHTNQLGRYYLYGKSSIETQTYRIEL
jgi:hypothetical protein